MPRFQPKFLQDLKGELKAAVNGYMLAYYSQNYNSQTNTWNSEREYKTKGFSLSFHGKDGYVRAYNLLAMIDKATSEQAVMGIVLKSSGDGALNKAILSCINSNLMATPEELIDAGRVYAGLASSAVYLPLDDMIRQTLLPGAIKTLSATGFPAHEVKNEEKHKKGVQPDYGTMEALEIDDSHKSGKREIK